MKDLTAKAVAALRAARQAPGQPQSVSAGHRDRREVMAVSLHAPGTSHWHGLGSYDLVCLAEARDKAIVCRKMLLAGTDPIEHERVQRMTGAAGHCLDGDVPRGGERYIAAHASSWRNPKHAAQWPSTLASYFYPVIGAFPSRRSTSGSS